MLGSSSTCSPEGENPRLAVQKWTWVNLSVVLPQNPLSWVKFHLTYLIVNVFVLGMFVLKTPENRLMYIVVDKHQRAALKFLVYVNWLFTKQMNKVMNMFNHNLLSPFSPLSTEDGICLQKLLTVCVWLYFCLHVTKGRGVVRQTLCGALQRSVDYEALLTSV